MFPLNILLDIRRPLYANTILRVPPITLFAEAQNEEFSKSHPAMLLVERCEFCEELFFGGSCWGWKPVSNG
jgi:hypothetical protein